MADISQVKLPNNTTYDINAKKVNGHTVAKDVPSNAVFTDTTYSSKAAASGGTDVSLCTTGEKYTWNNKSDLTLGTTATTALKGNAVAKDIKYILGGTDSIYDVINETQQTVDNIDSRTTFSYVGLSIGSYGDSILLGKQGHIAVFQIRPFTSLPAGGYTTLATLSSDYTPLYVLYEDFIDQAGRHLRLYVNPSDRKLQIYNYGSAITANNNTYHNFSILLA